MMESTEYDRMIQRCLRCSICKWIPQVQIKNGRHASICPAIDYYNFHAFSGGGKIILANSIERGRIPLSETVRDIVYKCTVCGGCGVACKYLNTLEPLEIIMTLREKLVMNGWGPMPCHQQYIESIHNCGNPYNESPENRADWLPDDVQADDDADLLYYTGCTASYRRKEIAIATARVLKAAGIKFKIFGAGEICCGSPILRSGDVPSFKEIRYKNLGIIENSGAKTILCSCAGCYDTFKVEYPRFGKVPQLDIMSTSEFFNQLLIENRLSLKQVPLKVTYHDPCHLGRGSEPYMAWNGDSVEVLSLVSIDVPEKPKRCGAGGVYEAPREVICHIPGVELVEMDRIKEYSYCCGAGGGVKAAFPEFALHTARTRLEEAEATGASVIISACPFCSTNLRDAIEETKSTLQFMDISELLLQAIDTGQDAPPRR